MEFHDHKAIYLQIGDLICENILTRKWQTGEKIPSVREMAVNIEVNPNTVMRTYSYLQEQEVIYNKRGIGYFVADDAYEKTRNLMRSDFLTTDLPHVFKTMTLLKLTVEDLQPLFQQYEKERT